MKKLACEVLKAFSGRTLATAESLTGGGIGSLLTAIPGSSAVYKGGVISYTNEVKQQLLGVPGELLEESGPVCAPVAQAMATGVRRLLDADAAIAVTGLAGPAGDEYGHPVGTVFIGYADGQREAVQEHHFEGDRDSVRQQTVESALKLILTMQNVDIKEKRKP